MNYHHSLDSLVLVKNGASRISNWLAENENHFEFCINETNCSKWSKWLNDKTTFIYPCVCFAREQDCIFIEAYYKLYMTEKYLKLEHYFQQVLSEYELFCKSEATTINWMQKHILDWDNLTNLDSVIKIKICSEPYKTLDIQIDKDDFKHCFEFKELYSKIYHSNKLQL